MHFPGAFLPKRLCLLSEKGSIVRANYFLLRSLLFIRELVNRKANKNCPHPSCTKSRITNQLSRSAQLDAIVAIRSGLFQKGAFGVNVNRKDRNQPRKVVQSDNGFCYTVITLSIRTDRPLQTVKTQIRRHRMRRLIRVYTVCHIHNNILDISAGKKWIVSNLRTSMVSR